MRQANGRRLIGLGAMATAAMVAAVPAHAADAPFSLRTLMAATSAGDAAAPAAASGPDYRLHALAEVTPAQPVLATDSRTAALRRGFGAAMMDYFPFGSDGFHVSGGGRFYNRMSGRSTTDTRYAELLYAPRSALVRASRRVTPALTMGYTKIVRTGLSLGIEGGAMLGRFDTLAGSLVRPPRLRGAGLGDGAGQFNQVARLTFGYHF